MYVCIARVDFDAVLFLLVGIYAPRRILNVTERKERSTNKKSDDCIFR